MSAEAKVEFIERRITDLHRDVTRAAILCDIRGSALGAIDTLALVEEYLRRAHEAIDRDRALVVEGLTPREETLA